MATVFLAPSFGAGYQSFLANGQPNNGGFINTYVAGSTTAQSTFTTSAGNISNGNPIALGADGRPPQEIWLAAGITYKFIVTDAQGNILGTYDNLSGINDASATAPSEWLSWIGTPTFVSTTTFTLAGNVTGTFSQNMRVKTINTGGTVYGSVISVTYNVGPANTTIVILPDAGGVLDNGISAIYYSFINPTHTSIGLPPTGTQITIAPGIAPFFEGSQVNLSSGSAYVLNGNIAIKKAWLSNVGMDTLGNFTGVVITGIATVQFWGADDVIRVFTAPSVTAGTVPTFGATPTYQLDMKTGAMASASTPVAGSFKNLQASATGLSATVTVTADELVLENGSDVYQKVSAVSITINSAASGANGLDTGALATSTWYSLWAIYNPTTATVAGLISTSTTAPTMPSGYTHKARVGWVRTDGTANKFPLSFKQYGRRVQYALVAASNMLDYPIMASGAQGTLTTASYVWVSVPVAAFIPPTASSISLLLADNGGASPPFMAANPNAVPAAGTYGTVQPILVNTTAATAGGMFAYFGQFILESTNIYVAATAGGNFKCVGWEDNI